MGKMESGDESNEAIDVEGISEPEGGALKTDSIFSPYDPSTFSFLHLYRPQNDVVASLIYYSGMEGVDRYEISKRLGINAKKKAGNRTISNSINAVMRICPDNFGTFQKMEGRHRFLKYYAKSEQHTPAGGVALAEFYNHFKQLTGVDCPYKLGESIKFPQQNLSTLRISDVTLKRLVRILEYIYQEKVVITQSKIEGQISTEERKDGYAYQVDRKSLKKCLIALSKRNFLNLMKMEITERGMQTLVDVITIPKIKTLDHPLISEALKQIIAEFKEQHKSFPTGVRLKQEPLEAKTPGNNREGNDGEYHDDSIAGPSNISNMKHELGEVETGKSLLNKTFNTLQRLSLQKYSRKGGGAPISVLSQRSLNSLVDSAKRRRLAKPSKAIKKRRLHIETEETEDNDDVQCQTPVSKLRQSNRKDRRVYDTVDTLSLQHKAYLRSRFTQRERDMLLLIRACSFFLNPVTRFWPNPKVMRTLMHEYVPESRTKTTYSLMASGVREVRSKERYAHHQYIVKTMASYKELIDLRNRLASMNFSQANKIDDQLQPKDLFFMNAFRTSYQLLFREAEDFPSVGVADIELRQYLNNNNLYFLTTSDRQKVDGSLWKNKASDKSEIRHFVAFNTILSVLLSSAGLKNGNNKLKNGKEDIEPVDNNGKMEKTQMTEADFNTANFVVEQLEIQTLADVLEKMRTDGLIIKRRCFDMRQSLGVKGKTTAETVLLLAEETQNSGEEMEVSNAGETLEVGQQCPRVDAGNESPYALNEGSPQKLGGIQMGNEWPTQLRCSQFYQHFFQPEYHRNLYESLSYEYCHAAMNHRSPHDFGNYECPGQLLTLANYLCQNLDEFSIETLVPNSIKELFCTQGSTSDDGLGPEIEGSDVFEHFTASATKQLRYLENTELRLELLKVRPEPKHICIDTLIQSLPDPERLVSVQIVPQSKMPEKTTAECAAKNSNKRNERVNGKNSVGQIEMQINEQMSSCGDCCKKLFDLVDQAGDIGVSEEEVKERLDVYGFDAETVKRDLRVLVQSADIIICGIDKRRYVSARNGNLWLVRTRDGQGFVPRPWVFPSGRVNWKILKWMLEGVFSVVFNRSGLTVQELVSHFSAVMQPALTVEVVQILSELGCLSFCEKTLAETHKLNPFLRFGKAQTVSFVKTNTDGLERFVLFNEFKLKPFLDLIK